MKKQGGMRVAYMQTFALFRFNGPQGKIKIALKSDQAVYFPKFLASLKRK